MKTDILHKDLGDKPKLKINLFCPDVLLPSTLDHNVSRYSEWVTDGSGAINLYVNRGIPGAYTDTSDKPKYIWLLESREIIPDLFDYVENNFDYVQSKCNGIITCDKRLVESGRGYIYGITNGAPWVQDKQIHPKTKLISMISSNKTYVHGHKRRIGFVQKYRDQVDLYGRGFQDLARKEDGLRDYMFSIAVENASYSNYFTEKLTDCFACGTIPIFYGGHEITEYFNEDGIIFMDEEGNYDQSLVTPEYYKSKEEAIKENFEIACNMRTAEDYLYEHYFYQWNK